METGNLESGAQMVVQEGGLTTSPRKIHGVTRTFQLSGILRLQQGWGWRVNETPQEWRSRTKDKDPLSGLHRKRIG